MPPKIIEYLFVQSKIRKSWRVWEKSTVILIWGAKISRWSPVCQQIQEKVIEMFKQIVPQKKIAKELLTSSSNMHNIIDMLTEYGDISLNKVQEHKTKLDTYDLWSFGRHHINSWYNHMDKWLLLETFWSYNQKHPLKLHCRKKKSYVNLVQKQSVLIRTLKHLWWSITLWECVLCISHTCIPASLHPWPVLI